MLPAHLANALVAGHPWVYRNHVPGSVALPSGSWVRVRAGHFEAHALWDATSPIALRIFSRTAPPDVAFFRARVRDALLLRAPLRAQGTTAFRLLYGEGDGVPGVTVDVYGNFAVLVTYADSLQAVVPSIVAALNAELALEGVIHKASRREAQEQRWVLLSGREPPERVAVREHSVQLWADLHAGQKTGLFLDHRDNRAYVRSVAQSRRMLNLFAYTGAFSVYAALGGAERTTSVDIAPAAVAAARDNFSLNQLDPAAHELVVADVFDYLQATRPLRKFDLVVCDPPSFAASRDKQFAAQRAYVKLNALGLAVTEPGGLYAAASCTAQVSPEAFREALSLSAERAKVRFQIVHDVGQPLDHPVFAGHPEGRYLKFVVGRVLPLV